MPLKTPSVAEAKASLPSLSGPENDGIGANGLMPYYEFDLDYTDSRGRKWAGHFAAHVLTNKEKLSVGLMRAKLSGNTPPQGLDQLTADILETVSVLEIALDSRPAWATDLLARYDHELLGAIYAEVARYEARFRGPGSEAPSTGDGADGVGVDGARGVPGHGKARASG